MAKKGFMENISFGQVEIPQMDTTEQIETQDNASEGKEESLKQETKLPAGDELHADKKAPEKAVPATEATELQADNKPQASMEAPEEGKSAAKETKPQASDKINAGEGKEISSTQTTEPQTADKPQADKKAPEKAVPATKATELQADNKLQAGMKAPERKKRTAKPKATAKPKKERDEEPLKCCQLRLTIGHYQFINYARREKTLRDYFTELVIAEQKRSTVTYNAFNYPSPELYKFEDQKRQFSVWIKEEYHTWLVKEARNRGTNLTGIANRIIADEILREKERLKNSSNK